MSKLPGKISFKSHFRELCLASCMLLPVLGFSPLSHAAFGIVSTGPVDQDITVEDTLDRQPTYVTPMAHPSKPHDHGHWLLRLNLGNVKSKPKNYPNHENTFQWMLGAGYHYNRWILDLDLLGSQTYHNNRTTLFVHSDNLVYNRTSTFKPLALMANMAYELQTFFRIVPQNLRPYVGIGAGLTMNDLTASIMQVASTPGTVQQIRSKTQYKTLWGTHLGFTYPLMEHMLLDVSYRITIFKNVDFSQGFGISDRPDITSRGFFFGFVFR